MSIIPVIPSSPDLLKGDDVETASSRFETKRQDAASTKPETGSPKPEIRNPKSGDKEIDDG